MRRFGGAMSVLMLDLDKFKLINDTHGHLAGDAVLKKVAARCKAAVRESDVFARIGGEEFVALLPGTDEVGAIVLAEKLRSIIEGLKIKTEAETLRVTGSIGVASVAPNDRSISSALNRADRALYAAKDAGRNRVGRFAVHSQEAK
ncbi:GGDEF domain-containing protein [Rhodoligotrophos appendicifer]|uniref:GGDEF domain-containing protein n=1 Tax=Rhodoligotrophos appendicifer TaxID=987056 RepID=UPI001FE8FD91|nr:GGDEF domain-containing protein [Rhodoligotrophos appendicifer]